MKISDVDVPRNDPYYARDTDGVHFTVCVDGQAIWAHVARELLSRQFGLPTDNQDWVAVYRAHRQELDECVVRRIRLSGPEIVIIQLDDFVAGSASR
jgi:hypothetical protein